MEERCVCCGRKIPAPRLEALPGTDRCIQCSVERARTEKDVDLDGPEAGELTKQASHDGE